MPSVSPISASDAAGFYCSWMTDLGAGALTRFWRCERTLMRTASRAFLLSLSLLLASSRALLPQADRAGPVLAGLSNHGHTQDKPYVTAGTRAYLIGTQDGNFPDMGSHLPGEMAGAWLHPIKLIDGFWATVRDQGSTKETALSASTEFINYPYGNRFRYGRVLDSLEVERFQFSPDGRQGLIVQYDFKNAAGRKRQLSFQLSVKTDLRPVWFSDSLGITDAQDSLSWESKNGVFVARDTGHSWFCVWGAPHGAGARPVSDPAPIATRGSGVTGASRYIVSVEPLGTSRLTFVIAGSDSSERAAVDAYHFLGREHVSLLARKKSRYASILRRARITIPDARLQKVYDWVKVDTEWLDRAVPGMGRGLGGGLMEYPWWFGTDASYSVQALLAMGNVELAKQTLRLLRDQSLKANGNGRIVHEVTTNGGVVNPGNTQETAQFIAAVGKVVAWTGDVGFAREMYPVMKLGLHWLLTDMDRNGNLFPEGYGIMEVYGLNAELIDVAVYTQQALEATARIARVLREPAAAARYEQLASELKVKINERFWAGDEGSYADFYGSRAQAMRAAQGAITQIRLKGDTALTPRDRELIGYYERLQQRFAAMPDSSRGWITNKNWVIATPMEVGIAPSDRAIQLLEKIRAENVGAYGPFLSAVDRQAMMTIATGVQAVAEAEYGRIDEALWYVGRIVETFGRTLPGSISEMMPDYGCFVIGWTSYGIVVPLIEHVFGVQPDAVHKTVVFDPQLPAGWEDMSIEDLPVGTNTLSFSRTKTGRGIEYRVNARESGWTFVLRGKALPGASYYVNGRASAFTSSGIRMTGRTNRVLVVPRE
jgi:glycogen debranching enzyme